MLFACFLNFQRVHLECGQLLFIDEGGRAAVPMGGTRWRFTCTNVLHYRLITIFIALYPATIRIFYYALK